MQELIALGEDTHQVVHQLKNIRHEEADSPRANHGQDQHEKERAQARSPVIKADLGAVMTEEKRQKLAVEGFIG